MIVRVVVRCLVHMSMYVPVQRDWRNPISIYLLLWKGKMLKGTWSSLFGIDCKETSLFSYAIRNKNLIYILMFCAFLHQFRKSTVDVFKLTGRRTEINQTDHTAMLQHAKTFVWCCRAQPWMAQAMLMLKVWRKIGREICPERLASKLNYHNSSKLYEF